MYTKNDIFKQLDKMNAPKNSVVLMHTALRLVGEVENGAEGLLDALVEYFTSEGGLLCIPTHTWDNLDKDVITLDVKNSKSNLGAFTNVALKDKRAVRTKNPTHSMVVFGDREKVQNFIENEDKVLTPTAPDSCYGKLFDMGGYVLLVGVAQDKNTYLHTVDEILKTPNRMADKPIKVTVQDEFGTITEKDLFLFDCSFTNDISLLFPKFETAFRYHRCITDGFIGNAPSQLCDARKMKQTVELIYKNSEGNDPLANSEPIAPSLYC